MRRRQTDYEYLLDTGVFQALSVRNCESLERTGVRIMAGQSVPFELASIFHQAPTQVSVDL